MKYFLSSLFIVCWFFTNAQNNFSYSPEKPQPGEEISIEYTPSGRLAGILKIPSAFVMESSEKGNKVKDITLKREYGKLVGKFKTESSTAFVALGFMNDEDYDTNNDTGFVIQLYNGDQVCKFANAFAADYYTGLGKQRFEVPTNYSKALAYIDDELKLYPENKERYNMYALQLLYAVDKQKGATAIQQEIEKTISSLKEEQDYNNLSRLYGALRLENQRAFFDSLQRLQFSSKRKTGFSSLVDKFFNSEDKSTRLAIFQEASAVVDTATNPAQYNTNLNYMRASIATDYAKEEDWNNFKKIVKSIDNNATKNRLYYRITSKYRDSINVPSVIESLAKEACTWAGDELKSPKEEKLELATGKEWEGVRKEQYSKYADSYAALLYRTGKYKEGLRYAKLVAIELNKGENSTYNTTYVQLAEKVLSKNQLKPVLEGFVKSGTSSPTIKNALKKLYHEQGNAESGFENYFINLEKEFAIKKMQQLKEEMLNIPAPQFTLTDIDGKSASLADYKGKVVILDFWATWCGPCKVSFPSMAKMVNKYKDNDNVKFLFVDTWEHQEEKLKPVQDFINTHKYPFHVLMDNESTVVKDYKVDGIPTKFVIGTDGNIKFKDVGFGGEDDLLLKLPMMIELSGK